MEIKVFVVDDEERQRNSIIKHIDWKRYQMRVVGQSEDAEHAIELAQLEAPDLLITDIRMMGMDGVELSSRMRKINPGMHIIMVTGYEEFEYAKSAVDIGVDAFLVKPIIFDELTTILERICQSQQLALSKSREDLLIKEQLDAFKPIAREQFLREMIHGLVLGEEVIKARADALGMFASEGIRRVLIVVIDANPESTLSKEEQIGHAQQMLHESVVAICGSLLEEITTTQRGNIVLVLRDTESGDFEAATEQILHSLGREAGNVDFCKICIGAGPSIPALSQLSESFLLAQRAVNQRLLGSDEHTFRYQVLKESVESPEKSSDELIGDFFEVLGAGDSQSSLSLLGELLRNIAGNLHIQGTQLRSLCLQLISGANRVAAEIGDVSRHVGSEKKLWEQILDCREEPELLQETVRILTGLCDFIAERKKSHSQIVVQKALDLMNEQFKENLSLRSVAESVFLSPNYLGALFRSELGVSFTDQLIHIRVNKAKEMLQNSQLKLYEVAESVGYQNIGYFTSLFKRITGFSPKEYRAYMGVAS
ncbi:response regulator [Paenibacillus sp. BC26]|uniref:response regulator n=1 Tax=Paenibacillus sp. BC26 TaxID=1881032 RepID=UPI0008EFAB06|nr:response regulator [Paenibacillus sp. BC26]SFT15889.1 Helix-turn-helix domain-containing protein [Paenibacillus sp. BC26]